MKNSKSIFTLMEDENKHPLVSLLSSYQVANELEKGKIEYEKIYDDYFLSNDTWKVAELSQIKFFEEDAIAGHLKKDKARTFTFWSIHEKIRLEMKAFLYHKFFVEFTTISTVFSHIGSMLNRLTSFLNDKHLDASSLLFLDIDKVEQQWIFWLRETGIKVEMTTTEGYVYKSKYATFLRQIYNTTKMLSDTREIWEKDRWDLRILRDDYGIAFNESKSSYYLVFENIENVYFRNEVKRCFKTKLLSRNKFTVGNAKGQLTVLTPFLNCISNLEPSWTDLNGLTREHIEEYKIYLNKHVSQKERRGNANAYILKAFTTINGYLMELQRREYASAPTKSVAHLILPEDFPKVEKKSVDSIGHIPDFVLEQLFQHINELPKKVIPIIWVCYKTGLRISDALGLTHDCLLQANGKFSIKTDIEKTYVKGHVIPIDEHLAHLLAVLIKESEEKSNDDNNPNRYIFVDYIGRRKGLPYRSDYIAQSLNNLAKKKHIVDESGKIFHFKNHQFRHTFAIKMLNNGADILVVQELLAHASPEMTMRYARLLDDTKRKAFEEVTKKGVFSFDSDGTIKETTEVDEIPSDVMEMLWKEHKLNAITSPYGTCHARTNGTCPFAAEPPCLTINNGKPCYDLAVGVDSFDVKKYEFLIETAKRGIELAKEYEREDMLEKNELNLERYTEIYETIKTGNVVFGRLDRVKKVLEKNKRVVVDE